MPQAEKLQPFLHERFSFLANFDHFRAVAQFSFGDWRIFVNISLAFLAQIT
jgi:hypothetical protein